MPRCSSSSAEMDCRQMTPRRGPDPVTGGKGATSGAPSRGAAAPPRKRNGNCTAKPPIPAFSSMPG